MSIARIADLSAAAREVESRAIDLVKRDLEGLVASASPAKRQHAIK